MTRFRRAVDVDAPVHGWRLDETSGTVAADSYGSADGTYVGFSNHAYGMRGGALDDAGWGKRLSGAQRITVPSAAVTKPGGGSYTLMCLLAGTGANTSGSTDGIAVLGNAGVTPCYGLTLEGSPAASIGAFLFDGGTYRNAVSSGGKNTGARLLLHAVLDRSAALNRLYINGAEAATPADISAVGSISPAEDLHIGTVQVSGTLSSIRYLNGWVIDEVTIFDHALSATRIAAHQAALVAGTNTATVTLTIRDRSGNLRANATGLTVLFFDQADPALISAPSGVLTNQSTDASGQLSVVIPNSTLADGEIGHIWITNSDGTVSQHWAFSGPVAVSVA